MEAYPVMESFYTLQGEGTYAGSAAFFIRLAGCDVGCSWCDVKDSWDATGYPRINADDLAAQALESGTEIVVITGGEPLLYDLENLTTKLQSVGLRTHLETSGAHPYSGSWDWVCVSPKKFKHALPEVLNHADELKIIVVNKHDFNWANEYAAMVDNSCKLLVQPEWSKADKILPSMLEFVKSNPGWRISLQQHKYLGIP